MVERQEGRVEADRMRIGRVMAVEGVEGVEGARVAWGAGEATAVVSISMMGPVGEARHLLVWMVL